MRCTGTPSATVQSVHVHAHIVRVFLCRPLPYRPTFIVSNIWEIFQHFQKLGKGANIDCSFDL